MKTKALCAVLLPVLAVAGIAVWPRLHKAAFPSPSLQSAAVAALTIAAASTSPAAPLAAGPAEFIELRPGVVQGKLGVEAKANGRDQARLILTNKSTAPLRVSIPVGQVLENDENLLVVVRPSETEITAGHSARLTVQTAAARSTNKVAEASYRVSYSVFPKLDLLLSFVQEHLELSPSAVQTAVLAMTENLPLSAVAKFTPPGGELPSRFDTSAFRVDTYDIITALTALREIGVKDQDLAMTIDPQLKIEAMIEPLTRAAAMRYYGIRPESEWDYWKSELLSGDASTRHYALYGIARFYPDIALEMLPKWVRQAKTQPVYRLSALQALADTQRPEALPILRQLATELGKDTDLGKAADGAAKYLDSHLVKLASNRTAVAFRSSKALPAF